MAALGTFRFVGGEIELPIELTDESCLAAVNARDALAAEQRGDDLQAFAPLFDAMLGVEGREKLYEAASGDVAGIALAWSRLALEAAVRRIGAVEKAKAVYLDGIA